MKTVLKKVFFFLYLFLLLTENILAQTEKMELSIREILYNTRREMNSLNFKINGSNTKQFKSKSASNIFILKTVLDESYSTLLNVNDSDSVFKESLFKNYLNIKNWNGDNQVILDLIEDYNIKINSFNLGLSHNVITLVPVTVTTYDSTLKKISGYSVLWNFWIDKNNPKPYSKFDQFTSPSSKALLIPGVYDMWVQKLGDTLRYPSIQNRIKNYILPQDSTGSSKQIDIIIR